MKIGIVGPGAIGTFLAGVLATEHRVTLLGKSSLNIEKVVITGETQLEESINFTDDPSDLKEKKLVIISTKSFDTEDAVATIEKYISENTRILSLQNGLNNEKIISQFVGKKRTIGGITSHGVTYVKAGKVKHAGLGDTKIGAYPQGRNDKVIEICNVFNKAGIEAKVSEHIVKDIWEKGIVNSAINPITAISNVKNGRLLTDDNLLNLMKKAVSESCEVANIFLDVSRERMMEKTKNVAHNTSNNVSSMLQDINNEKKTEIEQINGEIIKKGKKNGIEPKINETLYDLVKSKENQYL